MIKKLIALTLFSVTTATFASNTSSLITLIVASTPGSNVDLQARAVAKKIEDSGVQIIVKNMPGANGTIAAQAVARAQPDGLTVGLFDNGVSITNMIRAVPNSPTKEQLIPVSAVMSWPLNVLTWGDAPFNDLTGMMQFLRKEPVGKYNYAIFTQNLAIWPEWLLTSGNAKSANVQGILYKGGPQIMHSVLSKETLFTFLNLADALPHIESGRIKVLAVGSDKRLSVVPNIPTISETYPGMIVNNFSAVYAPADTPPAVLEKLNRVFAQALASPEIKLPFSNRGFVVLGVNLSKTKEYYDENYRMTETVMTKFKHLLTN